MIAAAGIFAPLSLAAIAICMACIAVNVGVLATRYPSAGSSYSWIYRAFGRTAGAFIGWILLVANVFAVLATAIPAGEYTLDLFAPQYTNSTLSVSLVSAAWVVASGALLAAGVRPTAGVTAVMLIAEVAVLGTSAIVAATAHAQAAVTTAHAFPHYPAFVSAMILGIWMVDGWELSAATSEEARAAATPALGGLTALATMSAMLICCMFAYLHLLGPGAFIGREADAMTVVGSGLGGVWEVLIVLTVLVSTTATLWTTLLFLTRSLYAMGRDGIVAPAFGRLDAKNNPRTALIVVTVAGALAAGLSGVSPSVASALTLALSGSGIFLGLLFLGTAAAAWKLVPNAATRVAALVGMLGIGITIAGDLYAPDHGPLRWSALSGIILGIPFAFWRGRMPRQEVL